MRRLAKENIVFTVEGEGEIIGDATIGANPRTVEFGSAPVLIRSTRKAGKIKVKALSLIHILFPWRIYGVGKEDLDIARNTRCV